MSNSQAKILRPYGMWESPVTPGMTSTKLRLSDVQFSADGLLWLEGRSDGNVLVYRSEAGQFKEVANGYQPRASLAYGGGDFHVRGDIVVFVNKDGRLIQSSIQFDKPHPITPGFGSSASPCISPDGKKVLFVHSDGKDDSIGLVDLTQSDWPTRLVYGSDFYMQPAWHPDGNHIAWMEWDAPNMPWDGSRIKLANFDQNSKHLQDIRLIAGDPNTPVFQPEFSPDARYLSYVEGNGDLDQLVLFDLISDAKIILLRDQDILPPAWLHGMRVYGWSGDSSKIFIIIRSDGKLQISEIKIKDFSSSTLDLSPFTSFSQISIFSGENFSCIAASPFDPLSVIRKSNNKMDLVRSSIDVTSIQEELPTPQPVSWSNLAGDIIHGFYYPPHNSKYYAEGLPPAIIHIHGGPTAQADSNFAFDTTFFTSRGYAFLALNYRGSSGYGRLYQKALNHHWGEFDVDDAVSAGQFFIDNHLADPEKLIIKGSSAGGYTLLNTLIRNPQLFKAAICSYPVSNLLTIIEETFKFEAHYYDSLIGPFPQEKAKYVAWSPCSNLKMLHTPMLLFHGDSDPVVPLSQSEQIVEALKQNRTPYTFQVFSGEGHGWRKAETIETYYKMIELFLNENVLTQ